MFFNNFSIAFTCGVLGLLQFIYKFIRMASLAWQRDIMKPICRRIWVFSGSGFASIYFLTRQYT